MASLESAGQEWRSGVGARYSARAILWVVIGLLWLMALWQSWECQGLFADGSVLFLNMIVDGSLVPDYDHPRGYANILPQYPALLAIELGVTDLHWLARLYSLGLFGVPTALYSVALVRASRDDALLATTLATVAMVFLTVAVLISGEYNIAYACAVFVAVWLTTAPGLRVADGLVLVVVAAIATRLYQHYVYLGPMLAALAIWAMARARVRPWFATTLYGIAAALFMSAGYIAGDSLIELFAEERPYLRAALGDSRNFYLNVPLDLLLIAGASIVAWGLLRPRDLRRPWPYLVAGLFVLLAAASPALVLVDGLIAPPYSTSQTSSRTVAGLFTAAFIVFVWFNASPFRALSIVKEPRVARRLVILGATMVMAAMPWSIMLTWTYARYLEAVRTTIRSQSGPISIDAAIFDRHPRLAHPDIAPSTLSLIMRTSPTDGVLVNDERNPADLANPKTPPDLGRFSWRD